MYELCNIRLNHNAFKWWQHQVNHSKTTNLFNKLLLSILAVVEKKEQLGKRILDLECLIELDSNVTQSFVKSQQWRDRLVLLGCTMRVS